MAAVNSNFRSEHDSIGDRTVPKDAYYGVQSLRAYENFHITGLKMHPEIINSIVEIKKASAITNLEIGLLDKKVADAIVQACDEIVAGEFRDAFIVDPIQGGAGTSLNMNANEVIANRAIEILGGEKGDYSLVNPNDHVNCGQSTNDVFPSAGKIAVLKLLIKARELRDAVLAGRGTTLEAIARHRGITSSYATRLLRLSFLSPALVKMIIDGHQPPTLTARRLLADTRLPIAWNDQMAALC